MAFGLKSVQTSKAGVVLVLLSQFDAKWFTVPDLLGTLRLHRRALNIKQHHINFAIMKEKLIDAILFPHLPF